MDEVTAKWINMREQKIQEQADEIERLREANEDLHFHFDLLKEDYDQQADEIERLREALRAINRKNDNPAWFNPDIHEIVETALKQRESE